MSNNSYNYIFRVKQTSNDIVDYYFDKYRLSFDISAGYYLNGYPPNINNIYDMSFIEFSKDFSRTKPLAIDLSNRQISNINKLIFGNDDCKYLRVVFDREIILTDIQFRKKEVGDVSFILWRRIPLPENIYSIEKSKTMPYGIVGDTTPVNINSIYNVFNNRSYDYVFQLIPNQTIPVDILYKTHATNDIFKIEDINDPSFIIWSYTTTPNQLNNLYINSSDISGFLSIEQLNEVITDLKDSNNTSGLINGKQLFVNNSITVNNNYPNFKISFNLLNNNIIVSSESKFLKYLGINNSINIIANQNTEIFFTFDPNLIPSYFYSTLMTDDLNSVTSFNHGNSIPNNSIVWNNYSIINFNEKRPITDGNNRDISNLEPLSFVQRLDDVLNESYINYNNDIVLSRNNNGIKIDVSNSFANNIDISNLTTNTIISDLSFIPSKIIDSNNISVDDLNFTSDNPNFIINNLQSSSCTVTSNIDVSYINITNSDISMINTNYFDLSNGNINFINSDTLTKTCINFVDNLYSYLRFDFNDSSDIFIENLKFYDSTGSEISFITWESSGNDIVYNFSNDRTNSFTKNIHGTNISLLFEFDIPTLITKYSYSRKEKIFNIDASNNTIRYAISENFTNFDNINWNNYIIEITLPYGNWTISEINAFLAETDVTFASSSVALGYNSSVGINAYEISNNIVNYDNSLNINSLQGLRPRNTHFNTYLPFTAFYINNKPVLGTCLDYQIHNIPNNRQPNEIYTFYNNSSFFEYFFDSSFLVPTFNNNYDINGLTPQDFSTYSWKYSNDYNSNTIWGSGLLTTQYRNNDEITTQSYKNIALCPKYNKYNIFGICNKKTTPDISYDYLISNNVVFDNETFIQDHYVPLGYSSYTDLVPDLLNNNPTFTISSSCIPLIDTNINSSTNINNKSLFIPNSNLSNPVKSVYTYPVKNLIKLNDNSTNLLSVYIDENNESNILIESDVSSSGVIYIYPSSNITENRTHNSFIAANINYLSSDGITTGALYNLSDDRNKYNEIDLSNVLPLVNKISPKTYYKTTTLYNESYQLDLSNIPLDAKFDSGYIAQDINNIPELSFLVDSSSTPMKLNYIGIQAYLTQAIKELYSKVIQRNIKISQLKDRINKLENN